MNHVFRYNKRGPNHDLNHVFPVQTTQIEPESCRGTAGPTGFGRSSPISAPVQRRFTGSAPVHRFKPFPRHNGFWLCIRHYSAIDSCAIHLNTVQTEPVVHARFAGSNQNGHIHEKMCVLDSHWRHFFFWMHEDRRSGGNLNQDPVQISGNQAVRPMPLSGAKLA